ncbi:TetR family transcriptional regulator [Kineococcus sp. T90]|nr:TetR family transcriptional regulator [Kineococcus indalonis]
MLETAERLLDERGYAAVSVDDLARGAGISRPTFYFYFSSKEEVLLALLDRVVAEARARRPRTAAAGEEPAALLRGVIAAVHGAFSAHRAVTVAAAQARATSPAVREVWSGVMEGFAAETAALVEAERARGAAPPGPPARDLAVLLNSMNERVLESCYAGTGPSVDAEHVVDLLLAVWLRAVYARPGPPPRTPPGGPA